MKSFIPGFLVLMLCIEIQISYSQEPTYEWLRTAKGTTWDEASAVACDNSGNSIITGYFDGSFTIGDSIFNAGTYADIFLVKHDPDGNLLWAKQLACEVGAYGESVYLDDDGNSILMGIFRDSIHIDNNTYYGYSAQTGFIAKFDHEGDIVWFNTFGGEDGWIWPTDLMSLKNDNIVCTGIYGGTVTFGDSSITTSDRVSFLAQYSSSGGFVGLIEACSGSIHQLVPSGIASDNMDNMYIGGTFQGTLTFSDTSITSNGYHDIFLAKFDDQGHFLWARQEGGIYSDEGLDIAVDHQRNAAITGYFCGSMTVGDTTLSVLGSEDIFIIKYDPDGNVLWARKAGGSAGYDLDEAYGIAADNMGNYYIGGHFEGLSFFGNKTLISFGSTDIFCAKYNTDGYCVWAAKIGGSNTEWGADIAANNQGDIFLTGWYASSILFGDTLTTNLGATDVCIVKFNESGINAMVVRPAIPNLSKLYQNYPNPFNPVTAISYRLSAVGDVELSIYNLLGQKVVTLVSGKQQAGFHQIEWDATEFSSGLYFYQLKTDKHSEVRKMMLIR